MHKGELLYSGPLIAYTSSHCILIRTIDLKNRISNRDMMHSYKMRAHTHTPWTVDPEVSCSVLRVVLELISVHLLSVKALPGLCSFHFQPCP